MTLPLRVTVAPERADAAPGDNLQFDLTVRNASDIVEHYGVEMLGLPDGAKVSVEPDAAKLRPTESGTLTVKVNLPTQPPAPAGTYVVGALVRSKYRHDVSRCVEVPIELASVEQITMKVTPEVVNGGRTGQLTVDLTNGGNAPVRLFLAATDPERRVSATFQPPSVDLPPGGGARVYLAVGAPLPMNREVQRQLTITANPEMPGAVPSTANATFVQQPRLASKFAKYAGIAAGVVVLAAAIAVPPLVSKAMAKDAVQAAATQQPTVAPPPTQQQQPPPAQQSAAAPPAATSAAAPPPVASAPAEQPTTAAATETTAPVNNQPREIDLTTPPDGVVASDFFRNQGFLVSADPGTVSVAGCENARSAAVVTDPTTNGRFMTSSTPDDPAKCHQVPLLIDFLPDTPAGAVQVTPFAPNTLTMEVVFRDLSRGTAPTLTVTSDDARGHGGIDFVLIKPADGTAPVAVTKMRVAPVS